MLPKNGKETINSSISQKLTCKFQYRYYLWYETQMHCCTWWSQLEWKKKIMFMGEGTVTRSIKV